MKLKNTFALLVACAMAATFAGCEADDSAPTRPRQPIFLQENENTDKRHSEEKPVNPAAPPKEFPGQGKNDAASNVVLAMGGVVQNAAPSSWGTLPHLHTLPRDHYATGEVAVPDTEYTVDASWGQGLPLDKPLHRDWQKRTVTYQNATSNHNPTYYKPLESSDRRLAFFSMQDTTGYGSGSSEGPASSIKMVTVPAGPNDAAAFVDLLRYKDQQLNIDGLGTQAFNYPDAQLDKSIINQAGFSGSYIHTSAVLGYVGGTVLDGFWMVWETITLPVMMVKQPPWTHVQTFVSPISKRNDPTYFGALSLDGPVAPTAYPGEVAWKYPWTRPLGDVPTTNTAVPELTPENSVDLRIKAKP